MNYKKLTKSIAVVVGIANLALFDYYVSQTNKIDAMQSPTIPTISRPVVFEELENAYSEREKLTQKLTELKTPPYNSEAYSNHLANLRSNDVSQLEKGLSIVDSDIERMKSNPAIAQYNAACDANYRKNEIYRASFFEQKVQSKMPYAMGGLSAVAGILASFAAFTLSSRKKD